MRTRERKRKPELKRTAPLRAWSGILNGSAEEAVADQTKNVTKNGIKNRTKTGHAGPAAGGGKASREDPISRGVNLGYKVVEDYVRRGRESAQSRGAMDAAVGVTTDLQKLTERMFQYASDFAGVWLEMLQRLTTEGMTARAASSEPATDGAEVPETAVPSPPIVDRPPTSGGHGFSLDVDATRRVEVSLDLRAPETVSVPLDVLALRSDGPEEHRLTDVRLDVSESDHRIVVRLRVPDAQPAGTYHGLVIDRQTNIPRGTLSVRIPARSGPPSP